MPVSREDFFYLIRFFFFFLVLGLRAESLAPNSLSLCRSIFFLNKKLWKSCLLIDEEDDDHDDYADDIDDDDDDDGGWSA